MTEEEGAVYTTPYMGMGGGSLTEECQWLLKPSALPCTQFKGLTFHAVVV